MKKFYQQPSLVTFCLQATLPVATSPNIRVNADDSVDAEELDVKMQGDWNIWGE